jgi:hypothetical protein
MKERRQLAGVWVQPSKIWPFALIAPQTGECQIAQHRAAPVLPGDDVLDFEGDRFRKELPRVALLGQQTIFTSIPGSLANGLYHFIHVSPTTRGTA